MENSNPVPIDITHYEKSSDVLKQRSVRWGYVARTAIEQSVFE